MDKAYIIPADSTQKYLGQQIGFVRVNQAIRHHNNNYECAAWWEDTEIQPGVYPLKLRKHNYAPNHLELHAVYDAVVTDDYFPALWGGVRVSNQPYQPKNVGQTRNIHYTYDVVESIIKTGYSPSEDMDFYINPEIYGDLLADARLNLLALKNSFQETMLTYITSGDGNYNSNLSMIAHYSKNMESISRAIMLLKDKINSLNTATEYSKKLFVDNTSWATL
jgi:hypothetical protein